MATYTIVGHDQKPYGPVTEEQLRQWIADGRVNDRTQVQIEGTSEWKPLSAFPELIGSSKTAPPPLSPVPTAKTSAMAVVSLVLGVLGLFSCGLTALIGL